MKPSKKQLHADLALFCVPGGLFDVEPCDLDLNVGKRCVFTKPKCPAETDMYTIAAVQRNYAGVICYRVIGDSEKYSFGRLAHPSEITVGQEAVR